MSRLWGWSKSVSRGLNASLVCSGKKIPCSRTLCEALIPWPLRLLQWSYRENTPHESLFQSQASASHEDHENSDRVGVSDTMMESWTQAFTSAQEQLKEQTQQLTRT